MKKNQVQKRMKRLIVPCDKLSQILFEFSADEYGGVLEGEWCGCTEKLAVGKKNEVCTPYRLELCEGYTNRTPLSAFDREVLFHSISAYEQGIRTITFRTALHSLSGGNQTRVRKEQNAAIQGAFDKLKSTRIEINLTPLFAEMPKYKINYTGNSQLAERLLPCRYFDSTKINGRETSAIELLTESPLMTVAKLKKQVLTYDATPLAISGQNNTPQVITLKNYLLRRIKLIESGRFSNKSLLFRTIYENCSLADAGKWEKQDARKTIMDILNSFKVGGVIKNFEFERQGNAYRSIKIIL